MKQKRPRGRPKGTEINDGRYLDQVADLMLKESKLKKTPAIARVVAKHFPEHQHSKMERRLLRKWNKTGDERLVAAKERQADARQVRSTSNDIRHIGDTLAELTSVGSVFSDHLSGVSSVFAEQERIAKQLEDIVNPPGMRWLEEQSRMAQQMQDMLDPPFMRQLREQTEFMQRLTRGF